MNPKFFSFFLYFATVLGLYGQESNHILDQDYYFPTAADNFNSGIMGVAMTQSGAILTVDEGINLHSRSSFSLDESRSIDLLLESVARSDSDAARNQIRLDIGNKYFDRRNYKLAKKFFSQIEPSFLSSHHSDEVNFKLGYIHLLDRNFDSSEAYFDKASSISGPYTLDAYYYLGISQYFLNKEKEAIASFSKVEKNRKYEDLIPFYLAQIYFKNEKYEDVISYAESKIERPGLKNKSQFYKMIGLSYLAKGNERKALDYLDQYASNTKKLTENEFYQMGLLHYKFGNNKKASENLKQLSHQSSEIGQMANYLLGAISIKEGNKQDARSAFKQSAKSSFYKDIQAESNFLYYKLSAELGEERAAILGLSKIEEEDAYYSQSQSLLSDLLIRSSDHKVAIHTIEQIDNKSPALLNAYQSLCYEYAMQLLEVGDKNSALAYLKTVQNTPGSQSIKNESIFWSGYILNLNGNVSESEMKLVDYLRSGDSAYAFESEYILAYGALDKNDFSKAKKRFREVIESYRTGDDIILHNDAAVRLADLELINNNYTSALKYYDVAISNDAVNSDYIEYQMGLTHGINGQPYDKLSYLEALIKKYPNSSYRDDALFEIGETLILLEKNNDAYKVFDSLTELFKESEYAPKAYMRKGILSYNQGDMEAALVAYEKGLKMSDNNEDQREALIAIEEIYLNELNNSDAYFKFLETEIGYKYEDITKDSVAFQVAYNKYKDGEYEKAIALLDDYNKDYNGGFFKDDAFYFQAESYVLLKQYSKGLKYYEEVLQMPESEYYKFALKKAALISYNHVQDFEKSYNYYDTYLTVEGEKSLEYSEAALFSAFKSNNCNGVDKYGSVVSSDTKASKDSRSSAYFYQGKCHERRGQIDEAIKTYNEVGKFSKNNQAAEASYRISKMFFNRQQLDSAETQAFETTKRAVNYPVWVARSLILIGDIYKERKDYLNASAAYESVIENFTDDKAINTEAKTKLDALQVLISESSRIKDTNQLELIDIDTTGND